MVKVKVFIDNEGVFMDEDVCVDIELSYLPRLGDRLYLSEKSYEFLRDSIFLSPDLQCYEKWFMKDVSKPFNSLDPIILEFANTVSYVEHNEGQDFVNIVLSDKIKDNE
jgi:hypothetical protein